MTTNVQGPLNSKFEKLAQDTLEFWHVPGVAVAVIDGSHTYTKGYGFATLPGTTVTPSTLFYAGSTTKAFTAAVMSIIVDDNEKYPDVQWDTPIHQLIRDDFVLENEHATMHTTIEDALSHRSGLPGHGRAFGDPNTTVKTVTRRLRHLPLTAEPRTKFQYCNPMFVMVSHVIETVTGRPLGELMRKWIWEPLGMNSTFFDLPSAKAAADDLAHGYYWQYDTTQGGFKEIDWMVLTESAGGGGVVSNVLDYAKWARAILTNSTPLSENGFKEWFRPRTIIQDEDSWTGETMYALGWQLGVHHGSGQRFYSHGGGMPGFGVDIQIYPDADFAVITMGNTSGTANFVDWRLAFHLVDEKFDVPVDKRIDWNTKNQSIITHGCHRADNTVSILYPHLPTPRLPLTLDLSSYTGTYHHPGFLDLKIVLSDSSKVADSTSVKVLKADRLRESLTFMHVSGNFFIARSKSTGDFGVFYDAVYPVEFRVGADGVVAEVGVGWNGSWKGMIWLSRAVVD